MLAILHTDSEPDMRLTRSEAQLRTKHLAHSLRPLGQYLEGMPARLLHHTANLLDVRIRHVFVEKVAHRVDEDHPRFAPAQGIGQLFGHEPQVESLLVGMTRNAPEPLGEGLGVTVRAPGADFRAAPDRVPR